MISELKEPLSPVNDSYSKEELTMINFDEIQQIAREARKSKKQNKDVLTDNIFLTPKDKERIESYVRDMEKNVIKFASDGRNKLLYDCLKIEGYIFLATSELFKEKNPRFYVQVHLGKQEITVDWSGKNEA